MSITTQTNISGSYIAGSYVDRRVAEGMYRELLGERPAYRVLNIYGKSGMGKSHFKEYLKGKYLHSKANMASVELNFENRLLHKPQTAIMHIAKELEANYDFNFMALWKAYAILWHKRYEHSPIMYAADLPYFHEIKKLIKLDKKGHPVIEIAKGLFGDRISKELEELKSLESNEIEARLHKFFASDLRKLVKASDHKDCVIMLDNVDLLKEHSNATPCAKDAWIRELITQVGKEALFVLFSQDSLNWQGCNGAWKDVVKSCELGAFAKRDAQRYIAESGFKDEKLKDAIAIASNTEPFWLSLAKYSYNEHNSYTLPTNNSDIYKAFESSVDRDILKLLKVVANGRFFNIDMLFVAAREFAITISDSIIDRILNFDFVKEISTNKYTIDAILKELLLESLGDIKIVEYRAFMFSYWENILQSLDRELIKNTPELIDEAIEEAWYHLHTINQEPLVHFEWLDYYVARFFMYAAWEPFVDRYSKIMPQLESADDEVSLDRLVSLYNNLAGLYESLGESKKSKEYYNKVIELSRPELLSA